MQTIEGSKGTVQIIGGDIFDVGAWAVRMVADGGAPSMGLPGGGRGPGEWWVGHAECRWQEKIGDDLKSILAGMPILLTIHTDGEPDDRICYSGVAVVTELLNFTYDRGSVGTMFSFAGRGELTPVAPVRQPEPAIAAPGDVLSDLERVDIGVTTMKGAAQG